MAKALPKRSDVPRAFTWDLESLYATPDDWERAFQHLEAQLSSFEQYAGRLTESPHTCLLYTSDAA
ncbi:MAG: hypothetical protein N2545_09625, partial [Thermoflexales bacterium]|nr:hypothetical protein [Thermoflexales bacterium]